MAYEALDLIAGLFYNAIGNPYLVALFIIGGLTMMLLAFRAPLEVILMILIPVIIGFVVNSTATNFLAIPACILITLFMLAGFLFTGFILYFVK